MTRSAPAPRLDSADEQRLAHDSIAFVTKELVRFRRERDWDQFHTPRNLALSIVIESGELLEHFQWLRDDEVAAYVEEHGCDVAEEVADIAIYVIQLSEVLGIPLSEALRRKLTLNAERYPAAIARKTNLKHTRLQR